MDGKPDMGTARPADGNTRRVRYPELDGLRGLSICLVIVGHFTPLLEVNPRLGELAGLGVLLFFGLSGFLITDLLLQERALTGTVSLRNFYARRCIRIFPAYYLFLGTAVALWMAGAITDLDGRSVLVCAAYLRNIFGRTETLAHTWSLALEEQFYLFWPALFLVVPAKRLAAVTGVLFLLFSSARTIGVLVAPDQVATGMFYMRPWFRMDSLLAGCLVALLHHGRQRPLRAPPAMVALGLAVIWTLAAPLQWPVVSALFISIQTVLVILVLIALRSGGGQGAGNMLGSGWLVWLGGISYSLYLWQQLFLVQRSSDWGVLHLPGVDLLAAVVCALASRHLVEKPFLRLRARFDWGVAHA